MSYYAVYDLQIGGYKAGLASMDKEELLEESVERIWRLSQGDEEPVDESMTDQEIHDLYGYEIREVTKKVYRQVLESEEYGLLTKVTLKEVL